jgi:uncharacterized membrane protein
MQHRNGSEAQRLHPAAMDEFALQVTRWAHFMARVIEAVGIGVIVLGALSATGAFAWHVRTGFRSAYRTYREHLGHAILLGLEFLVAADIIGTVAVEPSFYNLGVLAIIVAIRTFLSFSLEVEITGRWPWQQSQAQRAEH